MNLPSGLQAAPLRLADLEELTSFVQGVALDESGRKHFTADELQTMFTGPDTDLDRDTLTLRDTTGALVGTEWVRSSAPYVRFDAIGFVATHRLGEGIGTAMLDWAERVARSRLGEAPDEARVTLSAGVDSRHRPSVELMQGYGMEQVREFLEMRIDFKETTPPAIVTEGLEIRGFVPGIDDENTYRAIDEAFRDHYGHVERVFEAGMARFRHWMTSPKFDPELWWLAVDGGDIAGACLCQGSVEGDESIGYVGSLSVRRPWRSRGLAKALLLTAFHEFRRRGRRSATLHVDATNLTGATRLYEAVGMYESERYVSFETEIRPGEDLTVR